MSSLLSTPAGMNTAAVQTAEAESAHWPDALGRLLDRALRLFQAGGCAEAWRLLGHPLNRIADEAVRCGQQAQAVRSARSHALLVWLQQEPYTRRALAQPAGAWRDAQMQDLLHSASPPGGIGAPGRALFAAVSGGAVARSAQYRQRLLADRIDRAAASRTGFRILAVGAGYGREIGASLLATAPALCEGRLWVFEPDAPTAARVAREHAACPVEVLNEPWSRLLESGAPLGRFDLIYAPDLLDALTDRGAHKLLDALVVAVRAGGRLLVGNTLPGSLMRGYHQLLLGRPRMYREVRALCRLFGPHRQGRLGGFADPAGEIGYAEWRAG